MNATYEADLRRQSTAFFRNTGERKAEHNKRSIVGPNATDLRQRRNRRVIKRRLWLMARLWERME